MTDSTNPDYDVVNTSEGPMYRKDYEAKLAANPPKPKEGVALVRELQHKLKKGEITEMQYNVAAANAATPNSAHEYVYEPEMEKARLAELKIDQYNEFARENDTYHDIKESLDVRMAEGRLIGPEMALQMQDAIMRAMKLNDKYNIGVGADHFEAMLDELRFLKAEIRKSNTARKLGG